MRLSDFQRSFSRLVSERTVHRDDVEGWLSLCNSHGSLKPLAGIEIYRNNIFFGQLKSLAESFARTNQVMGDNQFTALATDFLGSTPSQSEDLLDLSDKFLEYLYTKNGTENFLAYAEIDRAWEKAFYAPYDEALSWAALEQLSSISLEQIHLKFRASATIIDGLIPHEIFSKQSHDACIVWRDDAYVRRVDAIEEKLLPTMRCLRNNEPLSSIAKTISPEDIGELLIVLVERKWLSTSWD